MHIFRFIFFPISVSVSKTIKEWQFTWLNKQVLKDPRWGRCYESYSEDTEIVRKMTSIVSGLQGQAPEGHEHGYPFVAGKYAKSIYKNFNKMFSLKLSIES